MSTRVFAGDPWCPTVPRRRVVHAAPRRAGPRVPVVAAASLAAVALLACGTADPDAADVAVLADRADRLAEHLDAGAGCQAEREGDDLVTRARDAVAAENLSQQAAEEIMAVVSEVTSAVPCDDAAPEEGPATEREREHAEDEREDAEDEGTEEEGTEEEGTEDVEEEREDAEDEVTEESQGGGNNGNGSPGRSEAPPGQRNNPGRGR